MTSFLAALLNSLDIGMLLFLIAAGLSIVFGVLGVLNFAHGAMYMLGAYGAYTFMSITHFPFVATLIVVPIVLGFFGYFLERTILHHVYGRHVTDSLLLTFAMLLILDDLTRMIWGSGIKVIDPPKILAGSLGVFGIRYPVYGFFIMGAGICVGIGLWFLFNWTGFGKRVRAASSDPETASCIGINVKQLFAKVFAFGVGIAAIGGVLAAPARAIGPAMGDKIIIQSFIVVVIGGLGSVPGAFVGAIIMGFLHGFGARWLPDMHMVLPYLGLAAVLLFRPQGLMGGSKE